jgi:glycosyltransferase involved in cell wall biosynthesis
MANVLLITYVFPPGGGIGVPRALAYAKYLPALQCRLSILAPSKPSLRDDDPELCKLVPPEVVVHRAWSPELPFALRDRVWKNAAVAASQAPGRKLFRWLAQYMLFPDPQTIWVPFALRKARRIVRQESIDTVILNVPPFSTLKIGVALKKKFPHLTLISDFRDDWVGYYLRNIDAPCKEKERRALALEAAAVAASTYVSTVTEKWVSQFRKRYPKEPAGKFICTSNGFDRDMFQNLPRCPRKKGKVVITYFGTVHNNRIYSPANYLNALESLPTEICSQIETHFIGRVVPDALPLLKRTKACVVLTGFMPKLKGLRCLQESDFVLLIATDAGSHAGKLFDYLGCGKPILALSPQGGEIDQLLQRTKTGWCADPWDKDAIRKMILSAYNRMAESGPIINPDSVAVNTYSWPKIMAQFASVVGIDSRQPSKPTDSDMKAVCASEVTG